VPSRQLEQRIIVVLRELEYGDHEQPTAQVINECLHADRGLLALIIWSRDTPGCSICERTTLRNIRHTRPRATNHGPDRPLGDVALAKPLIDVYVEDAAPGVASDRLLRPQQRVGRVGRRSGGRW